MYARSRFNTLVDTTVPGAWPLHSTAVLVGAVSAAEHTPYVLGGSKPGEEPLTSIVRVWDICRMPLRPFLVMIWMTPDEASAPYSVAAAGPLTTSTLSMSSGLMLVNAFCC